MKKFMKSLRRVFKCSMERYIENIKKNGTNAEIEVFRGLSHGFGLGKKTVAKNWLNNAIAFWKNNMR